MDMLIVAALALLVSLVLFWLVSPRPVWHPKSGQPSLGVDALDTVAAWPPRCVPVMRAAEREAYLSLQAALPDHLVLAQLPLSRFMKVPSRHSHSEWRRRVGSMSVDLAVCNAHSQVIAAVEIRPPEGKITDRARRRQSRMDRVLEAAGIAVLVWREGAIPIPSAARDIVFQHLKARASDSIMVPPTHLCPAGLGRPLHPDILLDEEDGQPRSGPDFRDPPPSTWFDELDSAPVPLTSWPAKRGGRPPSHRGESLRLSSKG